ncbi:helix-turn-helix domain-containing protein [Achromobacter sp. GG226]|uniref:IclR family transcriptional regulator n=1 Tax=Verticiella alkaliphila TaxID=2779529 RepID=UPI001C0CD5E1|nr:helix-turn-helix domain-containing protein [Verticiella sp. GG226]MBU4611835.1 helix-turn-helix domain-containing protein [Verticiella sp. GG226]
MPSTPVHALPANAAGTVTALERGIAVLRCFTETIPTLSNAELSLRTGIPKPTVTRLATTLVSLGMLRQDPVTERFALAAGVVPLASAFLAHVDVRAVARPHMAALAERFSGAVYLAVRDDLDMVLIEIARSRSATLRSNHELGARIAMRESALGRAYLCALAAHDASAHARLVAQLARADRAAHERAAAGLAQAQADFAQDGLCLSLGEVSPLVHSVAVPLEDARGDLLALNFGAPSFAMPEGYLRDTVGPALREAVEAMRQEMLGR